MKTGDKISLVYGGKVERTIEIVVCGDSNGDGRISLADLLQIQEYIMEEIYEDTVYFIGADCTMDGKISLADLLECQEIIMNS